MNNVRLETLPAGALRASKTNPRKHFAPGPLKELADSIRTQGIRQPILARPNPGVTPYEIVAGERRWRAAELAGLSEVPVLVQPMTDREALEVQVVENLQRSDLTELEEAQSYQSMLDLRDETSGEPVYTAETLAERFGKERSHVYRRLVLLRLAPAAKTALEDGELTARTAVLVARIPGEQAQADALKAILTPAHQTQPLAFAQAREVISRDFMRSLKGAPFSLTDAELLPAAGACAACPRMTDNCAHLFSEEEQKEFKKRKVCTDPACYRAKVDAIWKSVTAKAAEAGQTVLGEKECREIFPDWQDAGELTWNSPYVLVSARPGADLLKPEVVETVGTWLSLIETAEAKTGMSVPRVLARDQAGKARTLVDRELAITAIEAGGEPLFLKKNPLGAKRPNDDFAEARRREVEAAKIRTAEAVEGLKVLHAALVSTWVPAPVWDSLFHVALRHAGADGLWIIAKWQGLKFGENQSGKEETIQAWADTLGSHERQALVPLLLIAPNLKMSGLDGDFAGLANGVVEISEIRQQVKRGLKSEKQAKTAATPAPKKDKRRKKQQLAEEAALYAWNEAGVATVPQRRTTTGRLPEGVKCEILVALAPDGKWRMGYELLSRTEGKAGQGGLPNLNGPKYASADEAFTEGFTTRALPFFWDDPAVARVVELDADPKPPGPPGQLVEWGNGGHLGGFWGWWYPLEEAVALTGEKLTKDELWSDQACVVRRGEAGLYIALIDRCELRPLRNWEADAEYPGGAEGYRAAREAATRFDKMIAEAVPGTSEAARAKIGAKYIKRVCGVEKPADKLTESELAGIATILVTAAKAKKTTGQPSAAVTTGSEQEGEA